MNSSPPIASLLSSRTPGENASRIPVETGGDQIDLPLGKGLDPSARKRDHPDRLALAQ
jgi:hypothetical protein